MLTFLRKHSTLISILLLVVVLISSWQFPSLARVFVIGFILLSLVVSISSILDKHRSILPQTEARRRIRKDILDLLQKSVSERF